jgi:hypothetical protein
MLHCWPNTNICDFFRSYYHNDHVRSTLLRMPTGAEFVIDESYRRTMENYGIESDSLILFCCTTAEPPRGGSLIATLNASCLMHVFSHNYHSTSKAQRIYTFQVLASSYISIGLISYFLLFSITSTTNSTN